MLYSDVQDGWLYAISIKPLTFEPHIAVKNGDDLHFVHALRFDYPLEPDGPHHVCNQMREWVIANGQQFKESQIFSVWSERITDINEALEDISKNLNMDVDGDWDGILPEGPPTPKPPSIKAVEELSAQLRQHEEWGGSSANIMYDGAGNLAGGFVTLFTANPYMLATLLRWIGIPVELIKEITRVEFDS